MAFGKPSKYLSLDPAMWVHLELCREYLKIFVCLGLKVVLPDGTVLSVKPVKSMVNIEKSNKWLG